MRVGFCVFVAVALIMSPASFADYGPKPNLGAKKLPTTVRLMASAKEQRLRAQLPKVENEDVQRILDDPALVLYSDTEVPPAYQDWSSGLPGVHAPNYNVSANRSEPFGNGNIEFPWGAPGGTHRTSNVSTFRFLWLPNDEDGKRRPVVWYRKFLAGSSAKGYAWTFPVGTVIGEVLRLRSPDGKYVVFTSDRSGHCNVYSVEIADFNRLPLADTG